MMASTSRVLGGGGGLRQAIRPRRNRKSPWIRGVAQETWLSPQHLVWPIFLHSHSGPNEPIPSMPGCSRLSVPNALRRLEEAHSLGIKAVIFFPAIPDSQKTPGAEESYNPKGIVPEIIRAAKDEYPDMTILTDVALDPYNSDGHDGLVDPTSGKILNDPTVEVLCQQALSHARAGADVIAPSDMMDGRVGAIRKFLDSEGFEDVSILSYTAKYCSAFYGPFRDALGSAPKAGDKKTYQMDPANYREARREVKLDEEEGADILMVKPAGPFLDVIRAVKDQTDLPVAAYQVSGEYAMLKAASANGWLNERSVVLESLMGIRRAGADTIFTYFAPEVARWLAE